MPPLPPPEFRPDARWTQRVGWLILIWSMSVLVLAAIAMLFRALMGWAGMTR